MLLYVEQLGFVFLGVGLGRRRGPEAADVAERGKRSDESGLRSVRKGVGTGALLVHAGLLGAVSEIDKVCDLIVGAGVGDFGGRDLAKSGSLLALCGVGVKPYQWDDGAEGCINRIVQAAPVEYPKQGVMSGMRHGQLLELEALML